LKVLEDWLRRKVTDYEPGVGRVFMRCGAGQYAGCNRVLPYYRLHGRHKTVGCPKCGGLYFRPVVIPEWLALCWLVWSYCTGKGDPRMPMRKDDRYA
jgi:hypothetical protein